MTGSSGNVLNQRTQTQWGYHSKSLQRHLRVVPLAEISIPPPIDPERLSSYMKTPEVVTEIAVDTGQGAVVPLDISEMIQLGRFGDETLFRVANGRHRLNAAKMLGVTHILALVDELKTEAR